MNRPSNLKGIIFFTSCIIRYGCLHRSHKSQRERERELTFQSFAKHELPLFIGLILQCLLHCYARVGGWEPFIALISSNLTFLHSASKLTMPNAHCMYSCIIECKQYKHDVIYYIVMHE